MTLVAGIDSSTQSCKVVVVDAESGRIVESGRATHPPGTEVAPEAWWLALLEAAAQVDLSAVVAVSVAGQQHGMVCLDARGEVIRDALLWNDTRSAGAAEELVAEFGDGDRAAGAGRWAEAVGSVPVASYTVTKLRWLADHEPEQAARIAAIALPHDWLTWKILGTGRIQDLVTDRSDASGTGYFDPSANEYRRDILAAALRISEAAAAEIVLPRIAAAGEKVGVGVLGGREVAVGAGMGDNAGSALGMGLEPGDAVVSIGTSGVACAVSDAPAKDPSGLVSGFADATGRFLPLVCTLNGARVFDAIARLLGVGHDAFAALALAATPGAGRLVHVPFLEGERTPNLPDATGELHGMTLASLTRENLARVAVEGVICSLVDALECLTRATAAVSRVLLTGGAAASPAVQDAARRLFPVPVLLPEPGEYVALGAARQAAWAASAASTPPAWPVGLSSLPPAPATPEVLQAYRAVRPWR
ncbi:MAG: xylulokinase [Tessaracoccus sp.]|uniref:xylulokinase n=1 Tax=Tessaracoccus sp. TaxID=1971211 RepID=UPI001EC4147C|nr:xylulokinase [Tessaracoccus sp.]MBK7822583.1 xylulokinase [Tessaracoccus sp.]